MATDAEILAEVNARILELAKAGRPNQSLDGETESWGSLLETLRKQKAALESTGTVAATTSTPPKLVTT